MSPWSVLHMTHTIADNTRISVTNQQTYTCTAEVRNTRALPCKDHSVFLTNASVGHLHSHIWNETCSNVAHHYFYIVLTLHKSVRTCIVLHAQSSRRRSGDALGHIRSACAIEWFQLNEAGKACWTCKPFTENSVSLHTLNLIKIKTL